MVEYIQNTGGIGRLKFQSSFVNNVARSSLAIFIIHRTFLFSITSPMVIFFYGLNSSVPFTLLNVTIVTLMTVIICVAIYWIFEPLWKLINRIGTITQEIIDKRMANQRFKKFKN